ncbi:MAG: DUF3108 domain-containing protein [Pseudomonadota bacterium]
MKRLYIASLFFLAATTHAETPANATLSYTISKGGITIATIEEKLHSNGKTYTLSSEGKASGLLALLNRGTILRTSRGLVTRDGLRPQFFEDQRTGRTTVGARLDWDKKQITLIDDTGKDTKPLPAETQDRLSFPYTFAFRAAPEKEFSMAMTDGRHLTQYRYLVAGKETLNTPLGKLETIHLVKQRDDANDTGTELWIAPAHHHLPVRILVTEKDGGQLDQLIETITY